MSAAVELHRGHHVTRSPRMIEVVPFDPPPRPVGPRPSTMPYLQHGVRVDLEELNALRTPPPSLLPRPSTMSRPALALAASGWVACAAFALPAGSTLRFLLTWGFMFVCPGAAFISFAHLSDRLERVVYSIAASAALAALVSMAFVLLGLGSAIATMVTLALITTATVIVGERSPDPSFR